MDLLAKRSVPAMLMALAMTLVSVVALLHSLGIHGLIAAEAPPVASLSNRITDHGTHLVYVPDGVSFHRKHSLLFALSPSGQPLPMISKWHKVADRHAWILAASKESKNGVPFVRRSWHDRGGTEVSKTRVSGGCEQGVFHWILRRWNDFRRVREILPEPGIRGGDQHRHDGTIVHGSKLSRAEAGGIPRKPHRF